MRRRHPMWLIVGMFVVGIVVTVIGFDTSRTALAAGSWGLLIFGLGFTATGVMFLVGTPSLVRQNRFPTGLPFPRSVELEEEPATFLARWRESLWFLSGFALVLGLSSAAWAVLAFFDGNWGVVVLAGLPAVYFLSLPVFVLTGRFISGGLWLTPSRIVQRVSSVRSSVRWEDVTALGWGPEGLEVMARSSDQRHATPWFRAKKYVRPDRVVLNVQFMITGAGATMMLLRDYVDDPSIRGELGTDAALDRVARWVRLESGGPPVSRGSEPE